MKINNNQSNLIAALSNIVPIVPPRQYSDDQEIRRVRASAAHLRAFLRAPRLITVNHHTPACVETSVNCHSAELVDH